MPAIETILVEVPAPDGPFGAKGVGEAPVCGSTGAIANAVSAAAGTRMREIPMTPPVVWARMQQNGAWGPDGPPTRPRPGGREPPARPSGVLRSNRRRAAPAEPSGKCSDGARHGRSQRAS